MEYSELVHYILDRDTCDTSCIFNEVCPVYSQGLLNDRCLVKRDLTFDVFYNLYVEPKKGLDTEIKGALYKMSQDAERSGDNKAYLDQLVKVKNAFYGVDRNKEVDDIAEVNISITPVCLGQMDNSESEIELTKPDLPSPEMSSHSKVSNDSHEPKKRGRPKKASGKSVAKRSGVKANIAKR